jgi:hypothetical protein
MANEFEVTTTVKFSDERIEDLLCGALEGGSNYWYNITGEVNPTNFKYPHPHLKLPMTEGCGLLIGDVEDAEIEPKLLNRESLAKGLKTMAEKYSHHFKNFMEENDDADTSDVFLQCCLFGEIVYG